MRKWIARQWDYLHLGCMVLLDAAQRLWRAVSGYSHERVADMVNAALSGWWPQYQRFEGKASERERREAYRQIGYTFAISNWAAWHQKQQAKGGQHASSR